MSEGGAPDGAVMRPDEPMEEIAGTGRPRVVHVADARLEGAEGATAAIALDAVARQLAPHAATFFSVGDDGELSRSIVHGGGAPRVAVAEVASWKRELRELDPLHPRLLSDVAPAGRDARRRRRDRRRDRPAPAGRGGATAGWRSSTTSACRCAPTAASSVGSRCGARCAAAAARPASSPLLDALQPLAEHAFAEAASGAAVDVGLAAGLTDREREVARLIAGGATNAEIARALHIGLETVKSHTRAILLKLGARSRHDVMRQLGPGPGPRRTSAARRGRRRTTSRRPRGCCARCCAGRTSGSTASPAAMRRSRAGAASSAARWR